MAIHTITVTCSTNGCGNEGIPIEMGWDSDAPRPPDTGPPANFMCGVCGEQITDVGEWDPPIPEATPSEDES